MFSLELSEKFVEVLRLAAVELFSALAECFPNITGGGDIEQAPIRLGILNNRLRPFTVGTMARLFFLRCFIHEVP